MSTKPAVWIVNIASAIVSSMLVSAVFAADQSTTPFKLGTFRDHGREFIGLVLQDTAVVDIVAANKAFERSHRQLPKVRPPADMKELISRYDADVGPRLRQLAATNAAAGSTVCPCNRFAPGAATRAAGGDSECRRELSRARAG
jgi:hypothetical protein